jgi:serine protease Do
MPEEHSYSTETSSRHRERSLPYALVKRAIIIALIAGLVGGGLGSYAFIRYFANAIPTDKKQLVVQESSAIVDVAKKASPSVVSITSKSVNRGFFGQAVEAEGAGTGIIVTSDGLILTNRHMVDNTSANYTVVTSDGKEYPNATVVSRDPVNDMAFVRIKASGLPAANLGDSSAVQVGQRVVAIGNALGQFQNTVTEGIISGIGRGVLAGDQNGAEAPEQLQNVFQTDAAINPGNSGGPLVNLDGQVIGINTAVAGQAAQNIGFAIPINEAKPLIASVKEKGRIVRPYLGVRYMLLTRDIATANDLKVFEGAWVQGDDQNPGVVAGSPAEQAGLKQGDVITKLDNDKITSTASLQSIIAKHKPGNKVKLTVVRDGKPQTIEVTLAEAPSGQ